MATKSARIWARASVIPIIATEPIFKNAIFLRLWIRRPLGVGKTSNDLDD